MVAAFDYCLHGKGGAAPSHRHRDARPRRRRARRPPAPRLRDRAGHRRGRGEAHRAMLRRPGGVGAVAAARLPARPRHRRDQGRRTRRRSACILGGHGITAWGETSEQAEANSLEIIRTGAGVPGRTRRRRAVRPGGAGQRGAARGRTARQGRRDLPDRPRPRLHRPAAGRPLHRQRAGAGVPVPRRSWPRWPSWARPAPTISCAPRSSRWSWTCPPRRRSRRSSPG